MIKNWEIISSIYGKSNSLNYTLLIDGTEHDARLIFKKLRGYAQPPQPATAPYVYSFVLPSDMDEDTLRKIQTAIKEGVEQAKKVNEFVPGGILGNPLFNGEAARDDKDFPTFMTLDPSESFFQSISQNPEVDAFERQQINLNDADGLNLESHIFALDDNEPANPSLPVSSPLTNVMPMAAPDDSEGERFLTSPDSLEEWPDSGQTPDNLPASAASTVPPRMANPLPVPPASIDLPEAVDFTPRKPAGQTPHEPRASFQADVDLPPVTPPNFRPAPASESISTPVAPAQAPEPVANGTAPVEPKTDTNDLPITDKDMLIKDMEGTMLGQMPLDDIFSAETKYDMFLDLENQQLVKYSEKERENKLGVLADGKDSLEQTVDSFEKNLPGAIDPKELSDVRAITDRIPQKDLAFIKDIPPADVAPAQADKSQAPEISDPFEQLMAQGSAPMPDSKVIKPSKPAFTAKRHNQPKPQPAALQTPKEEETQRAAKQAARQPQQPLPDASEPADQQPLQPGKMETLQGPVPAAEPKPVAKPKKMPVQPIKLSQTSLSEPTPETPVEFAQLAAAEPLPLETAGFSQTAAAGPSAPLAKDTAQGYSVEPAQALPDFDMHRPSRQAEAQAALLPEEEPLGNSFRDEQEKTFNLETTIPAEIIKTQYEKTLQPLDMSLQQAPVTRSGHMKKVEPEIEQTLRQKTFRIKAKKTASETDGIEKDKTVKINKVGDDAMPDNQGENNKTFRIKRIEQPVQPMPQLESALPPPPPGPRPSMPTPTVAPAAPKAAVPDMSSLANKNILRNAASANTIIEKTKTIDHSIELPLSELKKHNWPLEIPLIPTFTLENMVISVNRFAHATAISVIDNPGKLYNPLVLHGPSGTGKTHFLNAIGYALSKKYGQENIFVTNGVRLSRGIQRYVMEGNIEKFENFISSVKAILIDDIHLIAINEQNRVYISNLLNKFLKEQKQIVVTSKYPPESLQKLEELINFRLDSGWISELKSATGPTHLRIVKKMLMDNGIEITEQQTQRFFGSMHMTLGTVARSVRRVKVLEKLMFPNLPEDQRSEAQIFEKLLATGGEDAASALHQHDFDEIKSIPICGEGEWGRIGFFYPQNNSDMMNWLVFALSQRAKELGIPGGLELAVRSSYSTENIISSAFKIANLCDNKKLKGAVILGPSTKTCDPSVRENFYDILTHMLEVMLIRCGIINFEDVKSPSTYVKILSELLR